MVTSFSSRWLLCWESWKPPRGDQTLERSTVTWLLDPEQRGQEEVTQRRMFFKRRARGGCPSCAARQRPWAAGQGGSPSPASSFPEAAWLRACDKAPCSEVGGASGKALAQWREAARNSHAPVSRPWLRVLSAPAVSCELSSSTRNRGVAGPGRPLDSPPGDAEWGLYSPCSPPAAPLP